MAAAKGHKWFAAFWDRMVKAETPAVRKARRDTLAGLSGRVVEIGAGNGANFELYPDSVTEIVATEPDPYMIERAERRASQLSRKITVIRAPAEKLPLDDASFDAAVSTLVLCTVDDQSRALAEVARILKPGGELRFFEHIRYQGGPLAWMQSAITPAWRWIGAGCRPNRDTAAAIRAAAFDLRELNELRPAPPLPPMCVTRRCIQGSAVRR